MALQRRSGRRPPINRVISNAGRSMAAGHVWFGSMLLKKDYEGGLLATLIQDQEQMRNHDSRNHLPGFVRFNF